MLHERIKRLNKTATKQTEKQTKRVLKVTATGYALDVSGNAYYHTCLLETSIRAVNVLADLLKHSSVSVARKKLNFKYK